MAVMPRHPEIRQLLTDEEDTIAQLNALAAELAAMRQEGDPYLHAMGAATPQKAYSPLSDEDTRIATDEDSFLEADYPPPQSRLRELEARVAELEATLTDVRQKLAAKDAALLDVERQRDAAEARAALRDQDLIGVKADLVGVRALLDAKEFELERALLDRSLCEARSSAYIEELTQVQEHLSKQFTLTDGHELSRDLADAKAAGLEDEVNRLRALVAEAASTHGSLSKVEEVPEAPSSPDSGGGRLPSRGQPGAAVQHFAITEDIAAHVSARAEYQALMTESRTQREMTVDQAYLGNSLRTYLRCAPRGLAPQGGFPVRLSAGSHDRKEGASLTSRTSPRTLEARPRPAVVFAAQPLRSIRGGTSTPFLAVGIGLGSRVSTPSRVSGHVKVQVSQPRGELPPAIFQQPTFVLSSFSRTQGAGSLDSQAAQPTGTCGSSATGTIGVGRGANQTFPGASQRRVSPTLVPRSHVGTQESAASVSRQESVALLGNVVQPEVVHSNRPPVYRVEPQREVGMRCPGPQTRSMPNIDPSSISKTRSQSTIMPASWATYTPAGGAAVVASGGRGPPKLVGSARIGQGGYPLHEARPASGQGTSGAITIHSSQSMAVAAAAALVRL